MSDANSLEAGPPYAFCASANAAFALGNEAASLGIRVWDVDGDLMNDRLSIVTTFGRQMRFPSPTGKNWNALEERLRDFGWARARGYLVRFRRPGHLRAHAPEDFRVLLDILISVGRDWCEWREKKVPFKTVFICDGPSETAEIEREIRTIESAT